MEELGFNPRQERPTNKLINSAWPGTKEVPYLNYGWI